MGQFRSASARGACLRARVASELTLSGPEMALHAEERQFETTIMALAIRAAARAPLIPPTIESRAGEWLGVKSCKASRTNAATVTPPATTNGRRHPRHITEHAAK